MGVWSDFLGGDSLLGKDGASVPVESLSEETAVAIYFSAHWCPPCRGFTPKLAEWYTKSLEKKGLKIVFVSSDRDEESFKSYFGEMPWLALPFDRKDTKEKLSKKCKVQGIPALVILDAKTTEIITLNGRAMVTGDPEGEDLPWRPKPLKEILGTEFLSQEGATVDLSAIQGKKLGIYFSAHWCPPCRNFTPILADVYKKLQEKGEQFEIVFASSDRDEAGFKEYFGEMPWKALPYADRKRKEALSQHFEVSGIPKLVILDEDLQVLNADAASKVRNDTAGEKFPWIPDLLKEVDEDADGIDEQPSLVVLQEKVGAGDQKKNKDILLPIAEKYQKIAKDSGEDREFNFFFASEAGQLASRVRDMTKLGEATETRQVVLMDISDKGGYYAFTEDYTPEGIEKYFSQYREKKLTRQQMG